VTRSESNSIPEAVLRNESRRGGTPALITVALVAGVVLLPPLMLATHLMLQADLPLFVFAAVQTALMVLALLALVYNWRWYAVGFPQLLGVAFVLWLGVATVLAEFRFRELASVPMLSPYASFVLWCSPLLTIPLLLRSDRDLQIALQALALLGWLLAASVLLPALGVEFGEVQVSEALGIRRVFGPIGDSVALLLSFFVVDAVANGRRIKLLVLATALLVTAGLAAMIVTLAALALMAVMALRAGGVQIRRSTPIRAVVFVPVLLLVLIIPAAGVVARLQSLDSLQFTIASRIGSYQAAWAVFAENWLTGVGFTGLKAVVYRYDPETIFSLFSENFASTAQNQVLQTATDAGVIGVFLLLAFWTLSLRQCFLATRVGGVHQATCRAAFAWGLGLCVANQTAVWLLPNSLVPFLFCLLVGLSSACARVRPGPVTPG
jgi:hypothetical protein